MTQPSYAERQRRARRDMRPLTHLEWVTMCLWVSGATYGEIANSLDQQHASAKSTIKRVSWKLGIQGVWEAIERFPSVPRPTPVDTPDMERGA